MHAGPASRPSGRSSSMPGTISLPATKSTTAAPWGRCAPMPSPPSAPSSAAAPPPPGSPAFIAPIAAMTSSSPSPASPGISARLGFPSLWSCNRISARDSPLRGILRNLRRPHFFSSSLRKPLSRVFKKSMPVAASPSSSFRSPSRRWKSSGRKVSHSSNWTVSPPFATPTVSV